MELDASELFVEALAQATAVVKQVRNDQFALETPDSEWHVRDLAGHMLYELSWVPEVLAGKTIEEVGDVYEDDLFVTDTDLMVAWERAAHLAETAAQEADPEDTVHLSYGDSTAETYLRDAATDQLIHAWDLGQAIGFSVTFEPALAEAIYEHIKDADLQSSGLFAPRIDVPDDADLQTKILALTGRSSNWRNI